MRSTRTAVLRRLRGDIVITLLVCAGCDGKIVFHIHGPNTVECTVPASVVQVLRGSFSDCSLTDALNVNETGQTWLLDNARFAP